MPTATWIPSPGEVVYADVQYSNSEQTKSRFAVVVSSKRFNAQYPDVIVAYATRSSKVKFAQAYDVAIPKEHREFRRTGLPLPTTVRCGRLWSLDKRSVRHVAGVVPADLFCGIIRLVRECFAES